MDEQLTFAGFPVTLRKIDNDVMIHCKKVIGLYTQLDAFYCKKNITGNYPYGIKHDPPVTIQNSIRNTLKVACLEGTHEEMETIYSECKKLLKL